MAYINLTERKPGIYLLIAEARLSRLPERRITFMPILAPAYLVGC